MTTLTRAYYYVLDTLAGVLVVLLTRFVPLDDEERQATADDSWLDTWESRTGRGG